MKQKNVQQSADPRMKIFGIVAAVVIIIGAIFIFSENKDESDEFSGTPKLKVSEMEFDFGDISMADGLVTHNFVIENDGDGVLEFSKMETSCMCTTVILDVDGKKSPKFGMASHGTNPRGWSAKINPGQSAKLEVTFDPNAHGPSGVGYIKRIIVIQTDDGGKKSTKQFAISANVTK